MIFSKVPDHPFDRSFVDNSRTADPFGTRSSQIILIMLPVDLSTFARPLLVLYLFVSLTKFKCFESIRTVALDLHRQLTPFRVRAPPIALQAGLTTRTALCNFYPAPSFARPARHFKTKDARMPLPRQYSQVGSGRGDTVRRV